MIHTYTKVLLPFAIKNLSGKKYIVGRFEKILYFLNAEISTTDRRHFLSSPITTPSI
jgi:hypothetical protein